MSSHPTNTSANCTAYQATSPSAIEQAQCQKNSLVSKEKTEPSHRYISIKDYEDIVNRTVLTQKVYKVVESFQKGLSQKNLSIIKAWGPCTNNPCVFASRSEQDELESLKKQIKPLLVSRSDKSLKTYLKYFNQKVADIPKLEEKTDPRHPILRKTYSFILNEIDHAIASRK